MEFAEKIVDSRKKWYTGAYDIKIYYYVNGITL